MNKELVAVLFYFVVIIIYMMYICFVDKRYYKIILAICLPIVGLLVGFIISYMEKKEVIDIFSNKEAKLDKGIGYESISDGIFMPIQEALLIGDYSTRRRVILNAIRINPDNFTPCLQMALSNADSETSHYAASAIMEMQSKIIARLQKLSILYNTNSDNQDFLADYADILEKYIKCGLFDEKGTTKYKEIYNDVLVSIINKGVFNMPKFYINKIELDIVAGDYESAIHYAQKLITEFPENEEAYRNLVKIAVETGDYALLNKTQNMILSSGQIFTYQFKEQMRYWEKEISHG